MSPSSPRPFPPPTGRHRPRGLKIVYEDRDLLVIDKEAGLLTMSLIPEERRTAERILTSYLRKGSTRSKLRAWVVHRLDRDTSGLLVFAKSHAVQQRLKEDWPATEKLYLAAVLGHPEPRAGLIESRLDEDKDQYVHSIDDPSRGRIAQTLYTVIRQTSRLSILRVRLVTGRKNQIRVHLAERGHPVLGDRKYGAPAARADRLALHARVLSFRHPFHGERMTFDAGVPDFFTQLAGRLDDDVWAAVQDADPRAYPTLHTVAVPRSEAATPSRRHHDRHPGRPPASARGHRLGRQANAS